MELPDEVSRGVYEMEYLMFSIRLNVFLKKSIYGLMYLVRAIQKTQETNSLAKDLPQP